MRSFVDSTVSADDMAPLGTMVSAGTVMAWVGSRMHTHKADICRVNNHHEPVFVEIILIDVVWSNGYCANTTLLLALLQIL